MYPWGWGGAFGCQSTLPLLQTATTRQSTECVRCVLHRGLSTLDLSEGSKYLDAPKAPLGFVSQSMPSSGSSSPSRHSSSSNSVVDSRALSRELERVNAGLPTGTEASELATASLMHQRRVQDQLNQRRQEAMDKAVSFPPHLPPFFCRRFVQNPCICMETQGETPKTVSHVHSHHLGGLCTQSIPPHKTKFRFIFLSSL